MSVDSEGPDCDIYDRRFVSSVTETNVPTAALTTFGR